MSESTKITMLSGEQGGVEYAAGQAFVSIGNIGMECVAVKCGEEKIILPQAEAIAWLEERGFGRAKELVRDALIRAKMNEVRESIQDEVAALTTWVNTKGIPADVRDGLWISLSKMDEARKRIEEIDKLNEA